MNINISLKDDIPDVFFNETLCGIPFIFDNTEYSSVNECFNDRKYSKALWIPNSVPYKHKVHLIPEGFLIDEERRMCYDNGNEQYTASQFRAIVCARLFILYYDQIKDGLPEQQLLKYCSQYYSCKGLVEAFNIDTCHVEFQVYRPDRNMNSCIVVCNDKAKFDMDLLHGYDTIHISYKDFNKIYSYKLQSLERDFDIVVHDEARETFDNYVAETQLGRVPRISVVYEPIDYCDNQIIAYNTIDDDIIRNRRIDWNNVYYWEGH